MDVTKFVAGSNLGSTEGANSVSALSEVDPEARDFGSDNCFSVSSFLTFNLVLASTVINVISNLNSNNNDNNNNNNNNNLNANVNGQGRSYVELTGWSSTWRAIFPNTIVVFGQENIGHNRNSFQGTGKFGRLEPSFC